jgi:hypothetical protein
MDSAHARLRLPFKQAVLVVATVLPSSPGWSVADTALKAFGMDG